MAALHASAKLLEEEAAEDRAAGWLRTEAAQPLGKAAPGPSRASVNPRHGPRVT